MVRNFLKTRLEEGIARKCHMGSTVSRAMLCMASTAWRPGAGTSRCLTALMMKKKSQDYYHPDGSRHRQDGWIGE